MELTTGEALALRALGHRFEPGEEFSAWREVPRTYGGSLMRLVERPDALRIARGLESKGLLAAHGRGRFSLTEAGKAAYMAMPYRGAGGRATSAKRKPAPGARAQRRGPDDD